MNIPYSLFLEHQNHHFSGSFDEARVWNAVLDESTIRAFACVPQRLDRLVSPNHPNVENLLARFVFKMIGSHVPNTVNLRNGRVFVEDGVVKAEGWKSLETEGGYCWNPPTDLW